MVIKELMQGLLYSDEIGSAVASEPPLSNEHVNLGFA